MHFQIIVMNARVMMAKVVIVKQIENTDTRIIDRTGVP